MTTLTNSIEVLGMYLSSVKLTGKQNEQSR